MLIWLLIVPRSPDKFALMVSGQKALALANPGDKRLMTTPLGRVELGNMSMTCTKDSAQWLGSGCIFGVFFAKQYNLWLVVYVL